MAGCKILTICVTTCLIVVFATEITKIGNCPQPPTLIPLNTTTLDSLEGFYATVAYYVQTPALSPICHRMRFTRINETVTMVQTRSRPNGLYIPGLPLAFDYNLRSTDRNGTFDMFDRLFQSYLGSMYVLSSTNGTIVLYSCRAALGLYSQDVYVINQNFTYTPEDDTAVKMTLRMNNLDWGYLRQIEQGRENCPKVMDP